MDVLNKIAHVNKYLSQIGNWIGIVVSTDFNKTTYELIDYPKNILLYTTTNARSMELFVYGFVSGFNFHNET